MKTIRKNKVLYLIFSTKGAASDYSRRLLPAALSLFEEETGATGAAVEYTELGKPYFPHLPYHLSVSHSGEVLAFAFAPFPIGIDLEGEGVEKERVRERYFTEEEKLLPFSLVWTGKEAVGKITGLGLSDALRTKVFRDFATLDGKEYTLDRIFTDGCLLTCAMEKDSEKGV